MKRVLYLANLKPNKFGSMEEHALFLSRELRSRGHRCYLGFVSEPEPEIREQFEEAGAVILTVYCGDTPLVGNRTTINLSRMMMLRRIVLENQIDIVHINFMSVTNPSLLGIYLTRVKIVYTEHASGGVPKRTFFKHWASYCVHRILARRIAMYVAVSDFVRNRLKTSHHLQDDKITTIYNGVNIERFLPRDRDQVRRELGFPGDVHIICSVAMLIPEKGIQHLIEAVYLLKNTKNFPGLIALIAGEGPYEAELKHLAGKLDVLANILFLRRRSDIESIIAGSDIVVVPSVWDEAFGLIIAEAMASGRPVVATRTGAIPELVDDKVTGIIVEKQDAQQIADAIKDLLSEHAVRTSLGNHGRKKAQHSYNLKFQMCQLVDLYNNT